MKGFLKFVLISAGILLLSAFLAPVLYAFLPFKFERIFNRLVMIGALLAAAIFVRVKKETLVRFGLAWRKESPGFLITGFLAGILMIACVETLKVVSGNAVWAPEGHSWAALAGKFAAALGVGLLIGLMEEFFFRGFVFRSMLKVLRDRTVLSVLLTSAAYSVVHFIGMKKIFIGPAPGFLDGIRLIGAPFVSLAQWPHFWPQAAGLFLFGLVLNGAVIKSGSLYPSIGLHAGCVWILRLDDRFVQFPGAPSLFWGSKFIYDGVIGWAFLVLTGLVLFALLPRSGSAAPPITPRTGTP